MYPEFILNFILKLHFNMQISTSEFASEASENMK